MGKYAEYVRVGESMKECEKLLKDRVRLRAEMRRVLAAKTKKEKRALWDSWKVKYGHNEFFIRELVGCARNRTVAMDIANWKLEGETV